MQFFNVYYKVECYSQAQSNICGFSQENTLEVDYTGSLRGSDLNKLVGQSVTATLQSYIWGFLRPGPLLGCATRLGWKRKRMANSSTYSGKPCSRGRLGMVDLLVITNLDQLLFVQKILFTFVIKQDTLMRRSTVLRLSVP